jgi:hypothetical protein
MSTRSTIRYMTDQKTGDGFHLYTDFMDTVTGDDVVNLELTGVSFSASGSSSGGVVTVAVPRPWAAYLGLVSEPANSVTPEASAPLADVATPPLPPPLVLVANKDDPVPSPAEALRNLLDALVESEGYRELEAGQGGYGPVVQGYQALGESMPLKLADWLESDPE